MNPTTTDFTADRRLDLLVLGPKGDVGNEPSTSKIQNVLNALLLEPDFQALLTQHHILTQKVPVPEGQMQPESAEHPHSPRLRRSRRFLTSL